jgi:hypothetical protein
MTALKPAVRNVLRVFGQASPEQVRDGLDWYSNAHDIACALDGDSPARAAGVLAALSPKTRWEQNVALARRAFDAYAELGPEHDGAYASGTLGHSCRSADRVLRGEDPMAVLLGPKVRAFCTLIAEPSTSGRSSRRW